MNNRPNFINSDQVPVPQPQFQVEEIDGELLLFNAATSATMFLNATAAMIWHLCDGKRNLGEIRELIKTSYPDAPADLESDIDDMLIQYDEVGCIRLSSEN